MKIIIYIFLFYVGFYFYRLAENHKRNKWIYGVLGIVTYIIGANIYPVFLYFIDSEYIDDYDLTSIAFKSFLIGIISVFVLFQVLSFVWNKKEEIDKREIDKIGK